MSLKNKKSTEEESFALLMKKDQAQLRASYVELARELMGLRFQLQAKQLQNVSLLGKKRRVKARVKTALAMLIKNHKNGMMNTNSNQKETQ